MKAEETHDHLLKGHGLREREREKKKAWFDNEFSF